MADRRRKSKRASHRAASTLPKRAGSRSASRRTTRRKADALQTPEMFAEFEAVMTAIEGAVRACIQQQRWQDLSAAVTVYAALLRLDPSVLMHVALIRPKAREALTVTDPDQQRYYAEQLRAAAELGLKPMSLPQAIANVRTAVQQRPAFDVFDALGMDALPGVLH